EIIIEDTTVHFFNDTDPIIIESIIKNVGGIYRGR
ncbi:MAG: hypothetical protein K0R21_2215, partial [Anaerocolumna sp.]|nr:hypothetical protein [Anaerocolumna sp.]